MSRIQESVGEAASQGAQSVGQSLKDAGEHARDMAREKYEHVRDSAQEYYEQGRAKAKEWTSDVETFVQERPIQSLLIAGGVGLLLGFFWRRS